MPTIKRDKFLQPDEIVWPRRDNATDEFRSIIILSLYRICNSSLSQKLTNGQLNLPHGTKKTQKSNEEI